MQLKSHRFNIQTRQIGDGDSCSFVEDKYFFTI